MLMKSKSTITLVLTRILILPSLLMRMIMAGDVIKKKMLGLRFQTQLINVTQLKCCLMMMVMKDLPSNDHNKQGRMFSIDSQVQVVVSGWSMMKYSRILNKVRFTVQAKDHILRHRVRHSNPILQSRENHPPLCRIVQHTTNTVITTSLWRIPLKVDFERIK